MGRHSGNHETAARATDEPDDATDDNNRRTRRTDDSAVSGPNADCDDDVGGAATDPGRHTSSVWTTDTSSGHEQDCNQGGPDDQPEPSRQSQPNAKGELGQNRIGIIGKRTSHACPRRGSCADADSSTDSPSSCDRSQQFIVRQTKGKPGNGKQQHPGSEHSDQEASRCTA